MLEQELREEWEKANHQMYLFYVCTKQMWNWEENKNNKNILKCLRTHHTDDDDDDDDDDDEVYAWDNNVRVRDTWGNY
jgi:hypothetical protein